MTEPLRDPLGIQLPDGQILRFHDIVRWAEQAGLLHELAFLATSRERELHNFNEYFKGNINEDELARNIGVHHSYIDLSIEEEKKRR